MFQSSDDITAFLKSQSVDRDRAALERELLEIGADPYMLRQALEAFYGEGQIYDVPSKAAARGRDGYRVPAIEPRRGPMLRKAFLLGVVVLGVVAILLTLCVMLVPVFVG